MLVGIVRNKYGTADFMDFKRRTVGEWFATHNLEEIKHK